MTSNADERRWQAAALVAIVLLVGSGLAYRAAPGRLADLLAVPPLPPGALAQLPLKIGHWAGHDADPLDRRVFEELRADEYLSRTYTRMSREVVALSIALRRQDVGYALSTQHLMPHEPTICYPAHGWTLDETRTIELEAADGSSLPVQIFCFHRGELEVERVTVLAYYIRNGRRYASPSRLRSRGWRLAGDIQYIALVQIACPGNVVGYARDELVCAFAEDSALDILELFSKTVEDARAGQENPAD